MATAVLDKQTAGGKVWVRLSEPWIYWAVGSVIEVTHAQADALIGATKAARCGAPPGGAKAKVIPIEDKMVRASTTKDVR